MSRSRRQRNKSMQCWHGHSEDGQVVSAYIGNDFSNGRRGMARAVKGAKKYVRSRVRAKNKIALRNEPLDG